MVLKKDGDTALALALLAQYITQVEPPHLNSSTSTILLAYTCIHMPIPSSSSQLTQCLWVSQNRDCYCLF
jgi:hypothetical protein